MSKAHVWCAKFTPVLSRFREQENQCMTAMATKILAPTLMKRRLLRECLENTQRCCCTTGAASRGPGSRFCSLCPGTVGYPIGLHWQKYRTCSDKRSIQRSLAVRNCRGRHCHRISRPLRADVTSLPTGPYMCATTPAAGCFGNTPHICKAKLSTGISLHWPDPKKE